MSLRQRGQMRLSDDDYLHKSARHPDEQLRLKLEIEFDIHSQQFPKCCLSDLQYVQQAGAFKRRKRPIYKNILTCTVTKKNMCLWGLISFTSFPFIQATMKLLCSHLCIEKKAIFKKKTQIKPCNSLPKHSP